jgi:predicted metalloprotease
MAEEAAAEGDNGDVVRLAESWAATSGPRSSSSRACSPTGDAAGGRVDPTRRLAAMTSRPALAVTIAASVLVLCATGALAASSPQLAGRPPDKTSPTTAVTIPPPTTVPSPTTTAAPPSTGGVVGIGPAIGEVVDVGDAKPQRFYDAYLAAALADIQASWNEEYPRLYGEPFTPLAGGIFAAYPERTGQIPGCGSSNTSYQEVSDYGAFYCPDGDFMVYDDGELGVIYDLANTFSPSVVAVVMAHEFGHAIQERVGDLDRDVPTVYTEQQADCFSGAWAHRAWQGAAVGLTFGDEDIRTGLIALVAVRDPVGSSVLEPGGHGSAFDRIGAFQEGFNGGVDNCKDLIDKPLPLLPNEFATEQDAVSAGNARYGWGQGDIMGILDSDLSKFWPAELTQAGTSMPSVSIRVVSDPRSDNCGDPAGMVTFGAVYCAASGQVLFDEAYGRVLYDDFGDFAVGYVIGLAWADAVQTAMGSQLQGEGRALASDCLVGVWIGSAIPGFDSGATTTTVPQARYLRVSPGDLDEAVQTALVVGDPGLGDNREGSAFEKIAAMRRGLLNGLSTCLADIQG